jgi:hypothetical protein
VAIAVRFGLPREVAYAIDRTLTTRPSITRVMLVPVCNHEAGASSSLLGDLLCWREGPSTTVQVGAVHTPAAELSAELQKLVESRGSSAAIPRVSVLRGALRMRVGRARDMEHTLAANVAAANIAATRVANMMTTDAVVLQAAAPTAVSALLLAEAAVRDAGKQRLIFAGRAGADARRATAALGQCTQLLEKQPPHAAQQRRLARARRRRRRALQQRQRARARRLERGLERRKRRARSRRYGRNGTRVRERGVHGARRGVGRGARVVTVGCSLA